MERRIAALRQRSGWRGRASATAWARAALARSGVAQPPGLRCFDAGNGALLWMAFPSYALGGILLAASVDPWRCATEAEKGFWLATVGAELARASREVQNEEVLHALATRGKVSRGTSA